MAMRIFFACFCLVVFAATVAYYTSDFPISGKDKPEYVGDAGLISSRVKPPSGDTASITYLGSEKYAQLPNPLHSDFEPGIVIPAGSIAEQLDEIGKMAPDDPELRSKINRLAWKYLDENPKEAMEWILSKPSEGDYIGAYEFLGVYLSKNGGVLALEQVFGGIDLKQRSAILEGAMSHLGANSLNDTIEFLFDSERSQGALFPNRNRLVSKLFTTFHEPAAISGALQSSEDLLPSDLQTDALDILYRNWSRENIEEALDHFVENHSRTRDFEYILSGIFSANSKGSLIELDDWIESVDPQVRERIRKVYDEWTRE